MIIFRPYSKYSSVTILYPCSFSARSTRRGWNTVAIRSSAIGCICLRMAGLSSSNIAGFMDRSHQLILSGVCS